MNDAQIDFLSALSPGASEARLLGNLLAVIHRDGGHHQQAVGTEIAVQDALIEYYRLRAIENATPPAEAVRQPLTEAQISKVLWEAEWPESMLSGYVREKLIGLIRSVELAHAIKAGITGAQE